MTAWTLSHADGQTDDATLPAGPRSTAGLPREQADTLTRPREGERAQALCWRNQGGIRELTSHLESLGRLLELHS